MIDCNIVMYMNEIYLIQKRKSHSKEKISKVKSHSIQLSLGYSSNAFGKRYKMVRSSFGITLEKHAFSPYH